MERQFISLVYNGNEGFVESDPITFAAGGRIVPYISENNTSYIQLIACDSEGNVLDAGYQAQIYPPLSQERSFPTIDLFVAENGYYKVRASIGRGGWANITLINNSTI